MIKLIVVTIFTMCTMSLHAQNNWQTRLKACFDNSQDTVIWMDQYAGLINSIHPVKMFLASNGWKCKGWIEYSNSGLELKLEGQLNEGNLSVFEVTSDTLLSGKWTGYVDSASISVDWVSPNGNIGQSAKLYKKTSKASKIKNVDDEYWVKWFEGSVAYEETKLILRKLDGQSLSGYCYNKDGSKYYDVMGKISGKDIELNFLKDEQKLFVLNGKIKGGKQILGIITGIGMTDEHVELKIQSKLNFEPKSYQNYFFSCEMWLPSSKHDDANEYIHQLIDSISAQILSQARIDGTASYDPDRRLEHRYYIYPDIKFVTQELISGHLLVVDGKTQKQTTIPLNFDTKKGLPFELTDLFKESVIAGDSLFHVCNISSTKQNYPYFVLSPSGIKLYGEWDTIKGRAECLLPNSRIAHWIKRNSSLKYLSK